MPDVADLPLADPVEDELPDTAPAAPKKPAAPAPAAKPAAPRPQPEPAPAPTKHTHSSRLVAAATALGFTQDDLDAHPSSAIWEEIDRIRAAEPARPAPAPQPPKAPDPVDPDEAYIAQLEQSGQIDARMAGILRKRATGGDAVKHLTDRLEAFERAQKQQTVRTAEEAVEAALGGLGKDYEPLIGAGSFEQADPGQRGWRLAIVKAAKIDVQADGPRAIQAKIAAAARQVAGTRLQPAEPAPEPRPAKPVPPQDPVNGRFVRPTAEDYENGHVARPTGSQTGVDRLNAVEQVRRYLKEHNDPRADRPPLDFGDDELPDPHGA